MTKHTEKAGPLPNASIDFDKVQSNAKAGKDDVFAGALSAERVDPNAANAEEQKVLDAAAKVRAQEAGREIDSETGALVDAEAGTAEGDAPTSSPRSSASDAASTGAAATARTTGRNAANRAK